MTDSKSILVQSLLLENFQALTAHQLDLNGQSVDICAPNGTGKTTVDNAVHWLFFDCDAMGNTSSKNAWWKPRDADNNPIHRLETVAEVVLSIGGKGHSFRRMGKEDWKRSKGSSTETFETHKFTYWLDGEKFETETEFFRRVATLLPIDTLAWMMNPLWFASWTDQDRMVFQKQNSDDRRRAILFEICGGVSEQSAIDATPELEPLKERGDRTVAQWQRIQTDNRNTLLKERDALPRLINECKMNLAEIARTPALDELQVRQNVVQTLRQKKAQAQAGGHISTLTNAIEGLQLRLERRKLALQGTPDPARGEALVAQRRLQESISKHEAQARTLGREVEDMEADLRRTRSEIQGKLVEVAEAQKLVDALRAERIEDIAVCPTCDQDLPQDKIATVTAKFNSGLADLAARKRAADKRLEQLISEGKALRAREHAIIGADGIAGTLSPKRADLELTSGVIADQKAQLALIVVPDETSADPASDAEYVQILKSVEEKKAELSAARESNSTIMLAIDNEIIAAEQALSETQEILARIESNKAIKARIATHEKRQKELGAVLECHDFQLYLCEQFVLAHAKMTEGHINAEFDVIQWKLFNVLTSGGIETCCKPTLNGSEKLSDGEKIRAGLDICRFFQRRAAVSVPIFVDRAESYTGRYPSECQIIRLRAVEDDRKELRVEFGFSVPGIGIASTNIVKDMRPADDVEPQPQTSLPF